MKAKEVSVGIQETGGELVVLVRMQVPSAPLEREQIPFGSRVKESARRRKEKEIAKLLETLEFPE